MFFLLCHDVVGFGLWVVKKEMLERVHEMDLQRSLLASLEALLVIFFLKFYL